MAFFNNLTISLKQKWLQFFQDNRSWITLQMEVDSVYTPDGGRRPPSYLILGVVNALEPQLAELMLPFCQLNQDADALINVLELNFDPDLVLGRFNSQVLPDELSAIALNEVADEVVLVESDDESIVVLDVAQPDVLGDPSLDEIADEVVLVESDDGESILVVDVTEEDALGALDEMAAAMGLVDSDEVVLVSDDGESILVVDAAEEDELGVPDEMVAAMGLVESDDESLETPNKAHSDESSDVTSDVWAEETRSESAQAEDQTPLGDDKQSEQDKEIYRLFPNL